MSLAEKEAAYLAAKANSDQWFSAFARWQIVIEDAEKEINPLLSGTDDGATARIGELRNTISILKERMQWYQDSGQQAKDSVSLRITSEMYFPAKRLADKAQADRVAEERAKLEAARLDADRVMQQARHPND